MSATTGTTRFVLLLVLLAVDLALLSAAVDRFIGGHVVAGVIFLVACGLTVAVEYAVSRLLPDERGERGR